MFSEKKNLKLSDFHYLQHGLCPSNTDNVEAMDSLNHKKQSQRELHQN